MAKKSKPLELPQGISASHLKARGWHRHANPVSIIALGLLLSAALFGIFGGQPHRTRTIDTPSAQVTLQLPEVIRNGMLFEMRVVVETKRPFTDLGVEVASDYWHDLTINTMIPAPADESSEDGRFRFSYGDIEGGKQLEIKIDGQINPPLFGGTKGDIRLLDGDTVIATIPVQMKVRP